jgi:tetratricopeptide (TPR) repeat protein/transglutaminase-like putative cysteine protease
VNTSSAKPLIGRFGVPLLLFPCLLWVTALFGQAARPAVSSAKETQAGGSAPAKASAPDYSSEAFVYEKVLTKAAFAKDGTETADSQVMVKVQSQAGVQKFSVIRFPYASADQKMAVVYVRARKADGTVVNTPLDTIQDMPAAITREAPYYSDVREEQVAVKGLEPGDTLEYEYRSQEKPLTPGEFWFNYDFVREGIALDEELDVSVPKDRQVIVGGGPLKPQLEVESGRRIYRWKTSRLHHETGDDAERVRKSFDSPPADVEITSFRNWAELGEWFRKLAGPRAAPTPEIRAKAADLTKGMTTDAEKLRAIYDYVSLKFRYVGVAFGIGRYQPHAAGEVLNNAYGDCKDKETLLAALLAAAGIKAYPVLINSSHKIDPAVPSPGQFDHVIAAVPQTKGYLWLDTTPEVAPAGYLLLNLRDRQALVIPDEGPSQLVKTPADPPYKTLVTFDADAKLNTAGTLESDMKTDFQDDSEIFLRLALRVTPEQKWNDLLQAISYRLGFGGKVSNATFSTLDSTDPALKISYHYTRKDYPSWSDGKITLPLPQFSLPDAKDTAKKAAKPIDLGAPGDRKYTANVTLPAGYTPVLPAAINLEDDFAEYHTRFSFANGILHGERDLIIKTDKVPVAEAGAYKKFVKTVNDDDTAYVPLNSADASSSSNSVPEKAATLFEQGRKAWSQHDLAGAADDFKKAIAADEKFAGAWSSLGAVHVVQGNTEQGIEEIKKAIAVDPKEVTSYKMLAWAEITLRRQSEALKAWQSVEKVAPDDNEAPEHIAYILMAMKRYSEAVPQLELAVKRDPTNSRVFFALGEAEVRSGHAEKAFDSFAQGLKLDPSPMSLNHVAYDLAMGNQHLDAALGYAQKAVSQQEQKTASLSLDSLTNTDLREMDALAYFWDTLGWVDFRLGHYEEAEKYVLAAWQLAQAPSMADHLGQIYQKEGREAEARKFYAFALAAPQPSSPDLYLFGREVGQGSQTPTLNDNGMPETRRRLLALLKSGSRADQAIWSARNKLTRLRSVQLPKLTRKSAMADLFVLIAAGPRVTAVKFISGPPELRAAVKDLSSARFDDSFPDAGPEKVVRRGVLDCEPAVSYCQFILMTPDSVYSTQ